MSFPPSQVQAKMNEIVLDPKLRNSAGKTLKMLKDEFTEENMKLVLALKTLISESEGKPLADVRLTAGRWENAKRDRVRTSRRIASQWPTLEFRFF